MSDNIKTLEENLGTPLAWFKDSKGEVVLDNVDNGPISRFFTMFKYTYDEENDDECNIEFQFPNSQHCDNPIFIQDTILKVQWGYLTVNRGIIKSPERSIAIRDKKIKYTDTGVTLNLECTDMISYLKNIKTNTVNKKSTYFVDWLKEISEGKFKATITVDGFRTLIEKDGTTKDFIFDEKNNVVKQKAVDNTRFETRTRKLTFNKVIKGKSLAITNAIKDLLTDVPDGPYFIDSTDDVLDIRPRNFNQDIFRSFTFKGVHGELLEFESKSDTRKIKEDNNISSSINPMTKKVNEVEIDTADTSIQAIIARNSKSYSEKPSQQEINQWLINAKLIYEHNIANPEDQRDIPPLSYKRIVVSPDTYMGYTALTEKPITYSLPAKEILNDPDLEEGIVKSRITNYTVEKIQTKYEAKAKILGDPSLTKAKIYYFSNLSKGDIGKWYSVKVAHEIRNGAYYVEMDLIKKPAGIVISNNSNEKTFNYNSENSKLTINDKTDNESFSIYSDEEPKKLNDNNTENLSTDDVSQSSIIEDMNSRLLRLEAEKDFLPDKGIDSFKIDLNNIPSSRKINLDRIKEPNNEKY